MFDNDAYPHLKSIPLSEKLAAYLWYQKSALFSRIQAPLLVQKGFPVSSASCEFEKKYSPASEGKIERQF